MPKIDPFEKHSDKYDAWFDENYEAYQTELEVIRCLLPSPDAEGLEVAVGSGKFAAPLGIRVGVEPSTRMAERAEQQGIHVHRNVAEDLPFGDNEFEFVLMVTTICFVDDILRSFREAWRVLKPKGCIIVGFVDRESELGRHYMAIRDTNVFYRDATFFSASEVLRHLTEAGFGDFTLKQALIPEEPAGRIQDGSGRGAFVGIKGVKQ